MLNALKTLGPAIKLHFFKQTNVPKIFINKVSTTEIAFVKKLIYKLYYKNNAIFKFWRAVSAVVQGCRVPQNVYYKMFCL